MVINLTTTFQLNLYSPPKIRPFANALELPQRDQIRAERKPKPLEDETWDWERAGSVCELWKFRVQFLSENISSWRFYFYVLLTGSNIVQVPFPENGKSAHWSGGVPVINLERPWLASSSYRLLLIKVILSREELLCAVQWKFLRLLLWSSVWYISQILLEPNGQIGWDSAQFIQRGVSLAGSWGFRN